MLEKQTPGLIGRSKTRNRRDGEWVQSSSMRRAVCVRKSLLSRFKANRKVMTKTPGRAAALRCRKWNALGRLLKRSRRTRTVNLAFQSEYLHRTIKERDELFDGGSIAACLWGQPWKRNISRSSQDRISTNSSKSAIIIICSHARSLRINDAVPICRKPRCCTCHMKRHRHAERCVSR